MRVVLLLTVLVVVIAAGLQESESQELDILQREARDAGRRKGKAAKKGRNRKQKGRRTKGNEKSRGKHQKRQKLRQNGRQTDCLADVVQAMKNYKKAQTQYRQGNRIKGWMENMDKKKGKAADQFKNTSDALESATGGGMSCKGAEPDADATEAQAILKNCSMSAAEKCDSTKITGINSTKIEECKTANKNYMTEFDTCLKTSTCDCFKALPAFDKDMCDMTATYDSAKASKTSCNSPSEPGSFGECSKKQKLAGELVGKCTQTCDTPVMTTKMMSRRKERLSAFQAIRN